ncbi:Nramp family divalent metal transporter [Kitasatospora azatica]|uniref:Nramp family divalent metal transporter n=1 Tax=Kitasatospora azatica TaxID=58347 RepID=UPI0018DDEE6D|nr:Nramp family divalent metal transporter [Kitasatospora azatica]
MLSTSAPGGRTANARTMLGPAFVAASAYVDPGNFATGMAAGSAYGYRLLWVVCAAGAMAVLVQTVTAKLGMATGHGLAELCRLHLPRLVRLVLWGLMEVVLVATELAEVVGGALALHLLVGVRLVVGGLITGAVAIGVLALETRGVRRFESAVAGLLVLIAVALLYDLAGAGVSVDSLGAGLAPGFAGPESLVLAAGIVGATVMPHTLYLHSSLSAEHRRDLCPGAASRAARRRMLRGTRVDTAVALSAATLLNTVILLIAAQLLPGRVLQDLVGIHAAVAVRAGGASALMFALALLASGLAASAVGTYTGQTVMSGFLRRSVPRPLRRAVTLVPALGVLAAGVDPTQALVWSQVVLCFGVPFALLPLLWFSARRDVMAELVNHPATTTVLALITLLITGLNALLLWGLLVP